MLSTPAAITASMLPAITAWAAKCSACCEEPHWRSTEVPGTDSGRLEASTALRATLVACSPTWLTQPRITSSTAAGSMPLRATSASMTCAARSTGCQPDNLPPRRPPAVRAVATMYASAMVCPSSEKWGPERTAGCALPGPERRWFNARGAGSSRGHPVGPQSPRRPLGRRRPGGHRQRGGAEAHAGRFERRHQCAAVRVAAEALAGLQHDVAPVVVERDPDRAAGAFDIDFVAVGQREDGHLRQAEAQALGAGVHEELLCIRDGNEYSEQAPPCHTVIRNSLHASRECEKRRIVGRPAAARPA